MDTAPDEPLPRKVTRADAFPLAPRVVPPAEGTAEALKSFGCSFILGLGAFIGLVGTTMTHTCGSTRSAELKRQAIKQQLEEAARLDEEAGK